MNTYSDGKLNKNDEGDLQIAAFIKDGRLILEFGKKTSWLGFDKKSLEVFIAGLNNKLGEM